MAISFEKVATIIESSFAPCACRCREEGGQVITEISPAEGAQPLLVSEVPAARLDSVRAVAQLVLELRQALSASPSLSLYSVVGQHPASGSVARAGNDQSSE